MSKWKLVLPALVLVGGLVVPTTVSFGKPEYSKTTGAKCTVCHSKGKELNAVGECYKTKKDLKACQAN
ncbi:MAG: hypothetical protein ABSH46_17775 [Bryobacteraceae bacterium]